MRAMQLYSKDSMQSRVIPATSTPINPNPATHPPTLPLFHTMTAKGIKINNATGQC